MGIRLVALDVDGTLTKSAENVSRKNLEAIRRAQEKGVYVTIATGRGYFASRGIVRALGIDGPVINYGGAQITDANTGKPIYVETLPQDAVQAAFKLANELGLHAQVYQGDVVIAERAHPFLERYCGRLHLPHRIDPDLCTRVFDCAPKVLVYAEPERERNVREAFADRLSGLAGVSKSEPGFIEINSIGASKGKALSVLAERLNISRAETAALGDSFLDISMIEWAGDGVAVENALPEVLAVADRVVASCINDGVAEYIERFVL